MHAAILTILLITGGSEPTAADCPSTIGDEYVLTDGNYYGPMVVATERFCRWHRFSPPDLYAPRHGYDSMWYRYFYHPTYNYRHQFNFPWRSP